MLTVNTERQLARAYTQNDLSYVAFKLTLMEVNGTSVIYVTLNVISVSSFNIGKVRIYHFISVVW